MVDAADLKSAVAKAAYGFESRPRHDKNHYRVGSYTDHRVSGSRPILGTRKHMGTIWVLAATAFVLHGKYLPGLGYRERYPVGRTC